jgi:hypothetical protein
LKSTNPFAQNHKIKLKKLKTKNKKKKNNNTKGSFKITNPFAQIKQPSSPHPNPIC